MNNENYKKSDSINAVWNDSHTNLHKYMKDQANKHSNSNVYSHNIYHIQTHDMDGNLTNEAFATNIFLNKGIGRCFTDNWSTVYRKILIGNGTTLPEFTDTSLESLLYVCDSNNVTTNGSIDRDTVYPATYDSTTGFFSAYRLMITAYWDYNITGVTEPFDITEIGYGISTSQGTDVSYVTLCTRSLVETPNGENFITKKPNERLTITMYFASGYHESLINDLWDNKYYACINPVKFIFPWNRHDSKTLYAYMSTMPATNTSAMYSGNKLLCQSSYDDIFLNQSYDSTNHLLTSNNIKCGYTTLEDVHIPVQGSFLCDTNDEWYKNFFMYHRELLDQEEELSTTKCFTNSDRNNSLLNNFCFGTPYSYNSNNPVHYGRYELPVLDFNISALQMYNHLTQEWDIDEEYENPYWIDYSEIYKLANGICQIWTEFPKGSGKGVTARIYINQKADDVDLNGNPAQPITSFNVTGVVVYSSDKYWDVESWKLIDNVKAIPEDQQNARYYIFTSRVNNSSGNDYDDHLMSWNRTRPYHKLIPQQYPYNMDKTWNLPERSSGTEYGRGLSEEEYGWFKIFNYLCYPSDTPSNESIINNTAESSIKKYELLAPAPEGVSISIDPNFGWSWGDRLIVRATGESRSYSQYQNDEWNNAPVTYYYQQKRFRMYYLDKREWESIDGLPEYVDIELDWTEEVHRTSLENWYSDSNQGWLVVWRKAASGNYETIIINVYGDDGRTPTQYKLPAENATMVHALNCTDYLVYAEKDSSPLQFHLFNMRTKEDTPIFTIDTSYSVTGIGGWKDMIYVPVLKNDVYTTFYYDINRNTLVELSTGRVPELEIYPSRANRYQNNISNDEVYVLGSYYDDYNIDNNYPKFISATNPSSILKLSTSDSFNVHGSDYRGCFQLKYMNDGKQLMLGLSTKHYYSSNSRISMHNIIDIGYAIDRNASVSFKPSLRQTDVADGYYPCQVLWKNGVITYDNNDNVPNLWWRPFEYYIRHKIVGTTKTIQAYNNPKRFGGKSFKLTITNDTSKLRD